MLARWARNPAVIGYLILTLGVVFAFYTASGDRAASRRQTCEALRVERVTLGKVVDAAIPPQTARQPAVDPALDPALRRLIEQSRVRSADVRRDIGRFLAEPIDLCRNTGVDPTVRLNALEWRSP